MTNPSIALLGLGTMGIGMANRLADAGYPLVVWNRNPERAQPLAGKKARIASSPRDAAHDADVVIAMLSDDPASRAVWLGENGALAGMKKGAIAIDASTLTIQWVRELAAAAEARGLKFLDAPVTGTKPHAANGELTFFVGGEAATLEAVRPILKVMSKEIVHLGPTGSGAAMKLVNNFLCGVQAAGLADALAMIHACGLNAETAMPVLLNGAPGSPLVKTLYTRHSTKDPTAYFQLGLMTKDISYAIQEARAHGLDLPTAQAALARFREAIAKGRGAEDFSAVLKP